MTKYLIAIINSASGVFLLHSLYLFIYKQFNPIEDDDRIKLLNSRIKKLENELKEFHIIIDALEDKVSSLEEKNTIKQAKLDYLLNNNYDISI